MEQMCEWGLEKGAGRTQEEVTANLHLPIEQGNLQVESWVRRRKVRIGEDVTCPVCLEELVEGEEVGSNCNKFPKLIFTQVGMVGCPCQHLHHIPCLTKWLRGHDTCPYCRGKVSK